jgi:hypothetical protein
MMTSKRSLPKLKSFVTLDKHGNRSALRASRFFRMTSGE